MTATRGIRNNNPGNIEYNRHTSRYKGCIDTDGRFCIFDTMHHGLMALGRLLLIYHNTYGINTIRGIINRWAPSFENNVQAYINSVESSTNYSADWSLDFYVPQIMAALIQGIGRHECGKVAFDQNVSQDMLIDAALEITA